MIKKTKRYYIVVTRELRNLEGLVMTETKGLEIGKAISTERRRQNR